VEWEIVGQLWDIANHWNCLTWPVNLWHYLLGPFYDLCTGDKCSEIV
jgi:hypothetical protein